MVWDNASKIPYTRAIINAALEGVLENFLHVSIRFSVLEYPSLVLMFPKKFLLRKKHGLILKNIKNKQKN